MAHPIVESLEKLGIQEGDEILLSYSSAPVVPVQQQGGGGGLVPAIMQGYIYKGHVEGDGKAFLLLDVRGGAGLMHSALNADMVALVGKNSDISIPQKPDLRPA